jgi:hypothetical protein
MEYIKPNEKPESQDSNEKESTYIIISDCLDELASHDMMYIAVYITHDDISKCNSIFKCSIYGDYPAFIINNRSILPIITGRYFGKINIEKHDTEDGTIEKKSFQNPVEFLRYLMNEYNSKQIIIIGEGSPFNEMRIYLDKHENNEE